MESWSVSDSLFLVSLTILLRNWLLRHSYQFFKAGRCGTIIRIFRFGTGSWLEERKYRQTIWWNLDEKGKLPFWPHFWLHPKKSTHYCQNQGQEGFFTIRVLKSRLTRSRLFRTLLVDFLGLYFAIKMVRSRRVEFLGFLGLEYLEFSSAKSRLLRT